MNSSGTHLHTDILRRLPLLLLTLTAFLLFCPQSAHAAHTHTYGEWQVTRRATAVTPGEEYRSCSCGSRSSRAIPCPDTIYPVSTQYYYSGTEKTPSITVTDTADRTIYSKHYTVTYSDNVLPGNATIRVALESARYHAVLTTTFNIALRPTPLRTIQAGTERFTVTWSGISDILSGVQIHYSTSPTFDAGYGKRISVSSTADTEKTIRGLEGNQKYYVRLRTMLKKDGITYTSHWSNSLAVTTEKTQTVDLVAVGDDLLHSMVIKSGRTASGGYNFDALFEHVKDDIKAADLAVINQETIFVEKNYTGYPSFGSPLKVADAISKAGFDVVTCATNHTLDRGTSAIELTMNYWEKSFPKMTILGIHDSKADAETITVVEKNGIRIAMLNFTYGLNGHKLSSGNSYMIDLLDTETNIRKQIRKAKEISDFVIVFPHWGTEYVYTPDKSQQRWAQVFADEGVDLVIGTHPHVIESINTITGKNGNQMICYYSLGNFVSNQDRVPRLLGGMATVTIAKDSDGIRIRDYDMIPLVTHVGTRDSSFTVYKLSDYTDALAKVNNIHKKTRETFTLKSLNDLFRKIMSKNT